MRNKNGVTHTATWRAQYKADEAAVLFFTGTCIDELSDLKLDTGKQWLMNWAMANGLGEGTAAELWKEPLLLQWWNLEWRRMDHYVILPMIYKVVEAERWGVYKDMHRGVFDEHHPNYSTMELALYGMLKRELRVVEADASGMEGRRKSFDQNLKESEYARV